MVVRHEADLIVHLISVRGERGFITPRGEWLIRGSDIGVDRFPSRPARVKVDGGFRFLHEDGRLVPPRNLPGFECATPFEEGHATIEIDGQGSMMNADGQVVLATRFRQLSWLVNGHAVASHEPRRYDQSEQAYCKIDITGRVTAETRAYALNAETEGYHLFWRSGRAGYMDAQLRVVIEPRFLRGSPVGDGLIIVTEEDGCHIRSIREDRHVARVGGGYFWNWFVNGRAIMHGGEGYYIIDADGRRRSETFTRCGMLEDGYLTVRRKKRWGLYDHNGGCVLDTMYSTIGVPYRSMISFSTAEEYGLMDLATRQPAWQRSISA